MTQVGAKQALLDLVVQCERRAAAQAGCDDSFRPVEYSHALSAARKTLEAWEIKPGDDVVMWYQYHHDENVCKRVIVRAVRHEQIFFTDGTASHRDWVIPVRCIAPEEAQDKVEPKFKVGDWVANGNQIGKVADPCTCYAQSNWIYIRLPDGEAVMWFQPELRHLSEVTGDE